MLALVKRPVERAVPVARMLVVDDANDLLPRAALRLCAACRPVAEPPTHRVTVSREVPCERPIDDDLRRLSPRVIEDPPGDDSHAERVEEGRLDGVGTYQHLTRGARP